MSNLRKIITDKIDAFKVKAGLSDSALGWEAVKSRNAVTRIRSGTASQKTIEGVERFIDDFESKKQ